MPAKNPAVTNATVSGAPAPAELEIPLAAVEERLAALGTALHRQDADGVEREAAALHAALGTALNHFGRAARVGSVPPALRRRLAMAGGQIAAQREALARATFALDRAIDVLLPGSVPAAATYSPRGAAERSAGRGSATA
jgi:hypothetical protein